MNCDTRCHWIMTAKEEEAWQQAEAVQRARQYESADQEDDGEAD
jgi:hypothetical protein